MRDEAPWAATIVRACFATSSADLRDLVNAIDRMPRYTKAASRRAASQFVDALAPEASSLSGGFQKANSRSPRGLPSSPTAVKGTPTSRSARWAGLPMVADVRMKDG